MIISINPLEFRREHAIPTRIRIIRLSLQQHLLCVFGTEERWTDVDDTAPNAPRRNFDEVADGQGVRHHISSRSRLVPPILDRHQPTQPTSPRKSRSQSDSDHTTSSWRTLRGRVRRTLQTSTCRDSSCAYRLMRQNGCQEGFCGFIIILRRCRPNGTIATFPVEN